MVMIAAIAEKNEENPKDLTDGEFLQILILALRYPFPRR